MIEEMLNNFLNQYTIYILITIFIILEILFMKGKFDDLFDELFNFMFDVYDYYKSFKYFLFSNLILVIFSGIIFLLFFIVLAVGLVFYMLYMEHLMICLSITGGLVGIIIIKYGLFKIYNKRRENE